MSTITWLLTIAVAGSFYGNTVRVYVTFPSETECEAARATAKSAAASIINTECTPQKKPKQ